MRASSAITVSLSASARRESTSAGISTGRRAPTSLRQTILTEDRPGEVLRLIGAALGEAPLRRAA